MAVQIQRRRFSVAEYDRLIEIGVLCEDERVELIEGEILEMSAIGSRHAAAVDRLTALFFGAFGGRCNIRGQNPIQLPPQSEPQPDLALLRLRADFYAAAHPTAADTLLVVEVADSSLEYDRRIKMPLYARNGITEAWLLDLEHDVLLVYREPSPDGYQLTHTLRRGETVTLLAFPETQIPLADLLG
jgi:Uma2 family endonuclease